MNRYAYIALCTLLLGLAHFGQAQEYYQYIDKNGNRVFTDDITKVPNEKQVVKKSFDSDISTPQPPTDQQSGDASGSEKKPQYQLAPEKQAITHQSSGQTNLPKTDDYNTMVKQLDQEKAQLDYRLTELQAERELLMKQEAPNMPSTELNAYEEKVKDLDDNIEQLKRERIQFMERARQFNERIKSRHTESPEQTNNSPQNK